MKLFFVKFSNSFVFGLKEQHVHMIITVMGILLLYLFIHRLVKWLVSLQSTKLISYILCSFLVIVLAFSFLTLIGDRQSSGPALLSMTLQVLAIVGVMLLFYNGVRYFYHLYFKK